MEQRRLQPALAVKPPGAIPSLSVEYVTSLADDDLAALCEATDAAILDGGGFGWVNPPGRQALERYFRGVVLVPERDLFIGRADGVITGSAQLVRPPRNNEAQAHAAVFMHSFVAPYARGHGLARLMMLKVEERARASGFRVLNLDVRETQTAAIALYESLGYLRWGEHPNYARVKGRTVRGFFYTKRLKKRRLRKKSVLFFKKEHPSMLTLYPALDIKSGQCVRLQRGDMAHATIYADDPAAQATLWQDQGATWLHVVDLDGAIAGQAVNRDAVLAILAAARVPVQLGGGLRGLADVAAWIEAGVTRVILGSAAVRTPELVRQCCRAYPGRVVIGIDARDGRVATDGWARTGTITAAELALRVEQEGVAALVYTDISRDGMLGGMDIDGTLALAAAVSTPVIASGGIGTAAHLRELVRRSEGMLQGVVLGRALYDGRLSLAEALRIAAE